MQSVLQVLQMLSGLLLTGAILVQVKGKGFGRSLGTSFTRRGLEMVVFKSTFVLAFVFIVVSILRLVL